MTTIDKPPELRVGTASIGAALGVKSAGWFNDPAGHHQMRYFDGTQWTGHVTHNGPSPCRRCAQP